MEIALGVLIGVVVVALFFAIRVSVLSRRSAAPYLTPAPQRTPSTGAVAGTPITATTSLLSDMADDLADIAQSEGGTLQSTHTEQVIVGPDGTRYASIDEITDPELRDRVQKALDRLGRLQWPET